VSASGGDCVPLETDGQQDGPALRGFPVFLPDGSHYLFVSSAGTRPGIYLAALNSTESRRVLGDNSSVVYFPASRSDHAHLLFLRDQTLMAQPFDEANLKTIGDPFSVASGVSNTASTVQIAASVSADGTLAYIAGPSVTTQLTWVDRSGTKLGTVGPATLNSGVAISPDGKSVLTAHQTAQNPGVWLYDLERGSENRFIQAVGASAPLAVAWSSDSQRVLLSMAGPAGQGLYAKNISGGELELLDKSPAWAQRRISDWSRDGRFLLYTDVDPKTQPDIWYLPMKSGRPDGEPVKIVGTDAVESHGQLSPDGKWLTYTSTESGSPEVYVKPFPSGTGVWKVSVNGGREPHWRSDGKALYFLGRIGLRALFVESAIVPDGRGGLKPEIPQPLFEAPVNIRVPQSNVFTFLPADQRFLVNMLTDTGDKVVNVITNARGWIAQHEMENTRTN
jgi:serine/threonine-protein kinase